MPSHTSSLLPSNSKVNRERLTTIDHCDCVFCAIFSSYYLITISFHFQGCAQKLEDNLEVVGIAVGVISIVFVVIEVNPCNLSQ